MSSANAYPASKKTYWCFQSKWRGMKLSETCIRENGCDSVQHRKWLADMQSTKTKTATRPLMLQQEDYNDDIEFRWKIRPYTHLRRYI